MILQEAITQIYPEAVALQDFSIRDDGEGQFIEYWNYNQPQPTESELQSAWFNYLKSSKKRELNLICNRTILDGFTSSTTGHTYGFDEEDQENIGQQLTLLLLDSTINSIDWKTKDIGVATHTREEFIGIAKDADLHKRGNINKYWTKIAELESATTEAEIEAIQW